MNQLLLFQDQLINKKLRRQVLQARIHADVKQVIDLSNEIMKLEVKNRRYIDKP